MAVAYKMVSDPDKEKTRIRRLVNRVLKERRLSLIVGSDVELGEDSTDQPAVWIVLLVDPRSKLTKSELGNINELARSIKTEIFQSNVRREPYVKLRTAA
jgi:hypothetical protein